MEKEFLNYEQSLALKELGFDEPCLAFYNGVFLDSTGYDFYSSNLKEIGLCIKTPLKQQAFRWFDENTSYQGFVTPSVKEGHFDWFIINQDDLDEDIECIEYYSSRQEAEEACINKLIELAKEVNNEQ